MSRHADAPATGLIGIIGGTGKVGAATARRLRAAGHRVRVIARTPALVPPDLAQDFHSADLVEPASLQPALAGVDTLFLITPFIEAETRLGLDALAQARVAGVSKVIYLAINNLEAMARIPHFANKIPIVAALWRSWPHGVVLRPNFFFQNDAMFLGAMAFGGLLPLPLGTMGVDAIDVDDIADTAVLALTTDRLDGMSLPLSGPDRLTGPGIAATYAALLGRPVAYAGDDLTHFPAVVAQAMPGADAWLIEDLRLMCAETQRLGNHAGPDDVARLERLLGRPLRRHQAFAQALVASLPQPAGRQPA